MTIVRARHAIELPCRFMLVAASNPCPCGRGEESGECDCQPASARRYRAKLSGALADRIDIAISVERPSADDMAGARRGLGDRARAGDRGARAPGAPARGRPLQRRDDPGRAPRLHAAWTTRRRADARGRPRTPPPQRPGPRPRVEGVPDDRRPRRLRASVRRPRGPRAHPATAGPRLSAQAARLELARRARLSRSAARPRRGCAGAALRLRRPRRWSRELALDRCVTIVGSRRASSYGLRVAEELGRLLAAAGLVVVSGMARGIDAAAHRGALAGGGITIAVLGGGPDVVYPAGERRLYREILAPRAR